jgi:hypothetical protein
MDNDRWDTTRDRDYIKDRDHWVAGPFCPLKRYRTPGEFPDTAYLFAHDDELLLHIGNILIASAEDPIVRYDSVEAILADGWRVD